MDAARIWPPMFEGSAHSFEQLALNARAVDLDLSNDSAHSVSHQGPSRRADRPDPRAETGRRMNTDSTPRPFRPGDWANRQPEEPSASALSQAAAMTSGAW